MNKQKLCENGSYKNDGINMYLLCNIDNHICTYIRYCVAESCIKMTDSYKQCRKLNKD